MEYLHTPNGANHRARSTAEESGTTATVGCLGALEMLIKIMMSLIAIYGLRWRQVDFTAAYLNASRDEAEVVYMRQPTGFEFFDASGDVVDGFTKALGKDKFKAVCEKLHLCSEA
ncbi:hypothetical protein N7516_008318 [Penicillium verrucosum]|uniref:uncharacterized protein n=1 Tax=Penicillium verrucosum TaxID=60171 RepID=UPI002545B711|nr:uncharacterized protein N7516_008318 [Penicillium verrucosum]KAJ5926545.1 hypothetical protein N7516_008318 [Penicillium verrucosum]